MQTHGGSVRDFEANGTVEALLEMREQGWSSGSACRRTCRICRRSSIGACSTSSNSPTPPSTGPTRSGSRKRQSSGAGILIRGGVALGEPGVGKGSASEWQAFEDGGLDELREDGESRTAFVLRFVANHPSAHCNLVGTTNPAHLRENIEAMLRGPLPDDVYAEAKRRLDSVGVSPSPV